MKQLHPVFWPVTDLPEQDKVHKSSNMQLKKATCLTREEKLQTKTNWGKKQKETRKFCLLWGFRGTWFTHNALRRGERCPHLPKNIRCMSWAVRLQVCLPSYFNFPSLVCVCVCQSPESVSVCVQVCLWLLTRSTCRAVPSYELARTSFVSWIQGSCLTIATQNTFTQFISFFQQWRHTIGNKKQQRRLYFFTAAQLRVSSFMASHYVMVALQQAWRLCREL